MRIVVCIRVSKDGGIGPFDAAAYESALRIPGSEVILLSMGPISAKPVLEELTRLGAPTALLLSDAAFAGSDTLATSYVLSLALSRLSPDLVFCGRQTLEGDTAQVGPGIAMRRGYALGTGVLSVDTVKEAGICCTDREGKQLSLPFPALLTFERICELRFPGIFSKIGRVTILNAADLGADPQKCGALGSPTRVTATFRNERDRRHCRYIGCEEFGAVLRECLAASRKTVRAERNSGPRLSGVLSVGEGPVTFAESISDSVAVLPIATPKEVAAAVRAADPPAVLFGSDPKSKELAARVAVLLETGLCADCTRLETDGTVLAMYRPAYAGDLIARIVSEKRPAMATVNCHDTKKEKLIFALGKGAERFKSGILALAGRYGAGIAASRAAVDRGILPYAYQVGLTGRSVCPKVYVALGISGAVQHLAGMKNADFVIAVNSDREAPIFDYADFGIVADIAAFLEKMSE